jgi:hypothetical protein
VIGAKVVDAGAGLFHRSVLETATKKVPERFIFSGRADQYPASLIQKEMKQSVVSSRNRSSNAGALGSSSFLARQLSGLL